MNELTQFLQQQRVLQIAPHAGDPWIANVYMGCTTPEKIYFIGSPNTQYGKLLQEDTKLAFATALHEDGDYMNRKGIQGVGSAVFADNDNDIAEGVRLHNQNYPEFADRITVDWVHTNERGSGVWVITSSRIKYWSDSDYGPDGSKEFIF